MNNLMPINLMTWMKWKNSKDTISKPTHRNRKPEYWPEN